MRDGRKKVAKNRWTLAQTHLDANGEIFGMFSFIKTCFNWAHAGINTHLVFAFIIIRLPGEFRLLWIFVQSLSYFHSHAGKFVFLLFTQIHKPHSSKDAENLLCSSCKIHNTHTHARNKIWKFMDFNRMANGIHLGSFNSSMRWTSKSTFRLWF